MQTPFNFARFTVLAAALALAASACSADSSTNGPGGLDIGGGSDTADAPDDSSQDSDLPPPGCTDRDRDGYGDGCELGPDCNDENPFVNPGVEEICGDAFDNNCDGEVDEGCPCRDGISRRCYDGPPGTRGIGECRDGVQTCEDGVWSACSNRRPSDEICDGLDNDCDREIDEGVSNACGTCGPPPLEVCGDYLDNDCNGLIDDDAACTCEGRQGMPCYSGVPSTLGIGICKGGFAVCVDDRFSACVGEILPAVEICDGIDNDCDGLVDEGLANACGRCFEDEPVEVCNGFDDDCDGLIDEGLLNLCGTCGVIEAEEICGDGLDNNCDGQVDEGCRCFEGDEFCWPGLPEQRYVGVCRDGTRECDSSGEFWSSCVGFTPPSIEICDGLDNDCDGFIDIGEDGCSVCGTEMEICDGIDNNCDGQIDEGLRNGCGQCMEDVRPEEECGPACCDGIDNDCDGLVDEGLLNICGTCNQPCYTTIWGDAPGEWNDGHADGLVEDIAGRLRLGNTFSGLPFLWIANSGEATVSKVNTATGVEEGRYPTGQSPSRTAVDFNGNVFVANRAFNGQGTVTRIDASGCNGTDCVRYTAPIGENDAVPRGMAIDENGLPWVGTYNDNMLRRLDPGTGAVLEEHDVGMPVYGIAIDAEGIIWFASLRIPAFAGGRIGAFSIEDQEVIGTWAIPGCSNPYSLAIDANGDVWLGNFTCNNLVHLDRETRAITTYTIPTLDRTRGVAVDGEDKIWVVSYGTNRVARFDPETRSFIGSYPVCQGPTGVAVAEDDHIWVSCWGSNNAYQLAYDGTHTKTVSLGRDPYGYSDMTGFQLRNFTGRRGTWAVQWDCGHEVCIFNEARWQATLPPEGEIVLRARVSQDGESWTTWAGPYITQPANLSVLPPGRFIEIEVQLRTSNRDVSPLLNQVELYWSRP